MRHIESTGEVLFDVDGRPLRMLGTVRDVTEQRLAQEQLHAAVRSRDQLLSLVSHDLRTPLNVIGMDIENLRACVPKGENEASRERFSSALARMARQTKRMELLLADLLDAAKLQADGALALELREVDLVQLTRALARDYQRAAIRHRIVLGAGPSTLVGAWDAHRIERVLNNLLSNAVKYSPAGGEIQIELGELELQDRRWAVLRIRDSGLGIPVHDRERIFKWFQRATNVVASSIGGTGIGLAGARAIVLQHGGALDFESEEGVGTTFTLRLPWAPNYLALAAASARRRSSAEASKRER